MSGEAPFAALRIFVVAARHESFLAAAEELGLTPSGVSRQIKALEYRLGVRLFDRFNRAVRLTDLGARLAADVAGPMEAIGAAVARLRAPTDPALVVSTLPSLASNWLAPRLHRFTDAHPLIDVNISADDKVVDLARGEADVAVRFGYGPYPGLHAVKLMRERAAPVCSPGFLASHPLSEPGDLTRVTLLQEGPLPQHLASLRVSWAQWLAFVGVERADPVRGPTFSHTHMVIAAALAGRGVALVSLPLAADEEGEGRLVRPFDAVLETDLFYWAVVLPERRDEPKIRQFVRWLAAEAAPFR